jgi:hypothetical protein
MQDIEQLIDALWTLKQDRAALNKQVATLKEQYEAIEAEVIAALQQRGAQAAHSINASALLSLRAYPEIVDPVKFRQHIITTGEIDLLENRPAVGAIRARWQTGEQIPGVRQQQEWALSLTKAK